MNSETFEKPISAGMIRAQVETLLRTLGVISNSQLASITFSFNRDLKDTDLVPVQISIRQEEVVFSKINGT